MNFARLLIFISVTFSFLGIFTHEIYAVDTLGDPIQNGDNTAGIYGNGNTVSKNDLRTGNITLSTIPLLIVSVIETLLLLAGSICVVAIIYHAVKMQISSGITGDSSGVDKAKSGVKGAMIGFVLSMSAWFLMTKLVAIFSGIG
jgi:hypothetical protein